MRQAQLLSLERIPEFVHLKDRPVGPKVARCRFSLIGRSTLTDSMAEAIVHLGAESVRSHLSFPASLT